MMRAGVPDAMARTGHYSIIMMEKAIHQDIINTATTIVNQNVSTPKFFRAVGVFGSATSGNASSWSTFSDSGSGLFSYTGGSPTIDILATGYYRYSGHIQRLLGSGGTSTPTAPILSSAGVGFSGADFSNFLQFSTWKNASFGFTLAGIVRLISAPSTVTIQYDLSAGDYTSATVQGGQLDVEFLKAL
jgi:hypothetical protein